MSTWWMDCKNIKKNQFSRWLSEIIHIIRFEMRMDDEEFKENNVWTQIQVPMNQNHNEGSEIHTYIHIM